ncbi:MAG: hypothetical protein LQ350_007958 [Teloschistes chrysophthalmus]|nr:MAG: hypothetical protein LQ350_007958 [Niorma chrysophthalma]
MSCQSLEGCRHKVLTLTSSSHAREVDYRQREHRSTSSKGKSDTIDNPIEESSFPAPLVLPEDDLALDPNYPAQSLLSWQRLKERNAVTPRRNVIYVAAPPGVDDAVDEVDSWTCPNTSRKKAGSRNDGSPKPRPDVKDIIEYISAFYHGMPVKLFPSTLNFTSWEDGQPLHKPTSSKRTKKPKAEPTFIGLRTASENIRIRTRLSPDCIYPAQLNLDDLLDVAISVLPSDAYALLFLVSHDLYEDDDDVFICGRAYGGSRVAVVSTARYDPVLDDVHGVDREHAWPASHCERFVEGMCAEASASMPAKKKAKGSKGRTSSSPILVSSSPVPSSSIPQSPLHLALARHMSNRPNTALLHLIRASLTAAHELGHCFGMDHCVYYACCMQGSASLAEDAGQPPYLCPVCEQKVLLATGGDRIERTKKLGELCERWGWASLGGWLEGRMAFNRAKAN